MRPGAGLATLALSLAAGGCGSDTVDAGKVEAGIEQSLSTATAKVDQSISVSYGTRANEEGIRWQIQQIGRASCRERVCLVV